MKKIIVKISSFLRAIIKNNFLLRSRINTVYLSKDKSTIIKIAGKIFIRKNYLFDPKILISREINFLKSLPPSHFPILVNHGNYWLEESYCGVEISKKNLPHDWYNQIIEISDILNACKIIHRDIKASNLMVNNGVLYLIDFGWAIFSYETSFLTPREMSKNIDYRLIYNNKFALINVIKSLL